MAVFDQRQRDVFSHGQRLKQRTKLEIHAESQAEFVEFSVRHVGGLLSEDFDRAARRLERADDVTKQGALAATGAAHDDHGIALY